MVHHHMKKIVVDVVTGRAHNDKTHCYTSSSSYKRSRSKLILLFFMFPLVSLLLLSYSLAPEMAEFSPPPSSIATAGISNATRTEEKLVERVPILTSTNTSSTTEERNSTISTAGEIMISPGTMYCDRSHRRTDICFMKGDIRTHSSSKSIHLYTNGKGKNNAVMEKIKPYTRKWETSVMDRIQELTLVQHDPQKPTTQQYSCDVNHNVPAIIFSAGGYTGNVYHEFNDGLIPLYITSHHFKRRVVFLIMKYKSWWYSKYKDILSQLSDYRPIDFDSDTRTRCFPEIIVGLRIHDELTVNPSLMTTDHNNICINDFHTLLDHAYRPRIKSLTKNYSPPRRKKPTLVLLSRTGSRSVTNENALVNLAMKTGFNVRILRPVKNTEMAKIYKTLNESEVLVGVHGAAMTHLLFMRPGRSVVIQIVPIGTEWPAKRFYEDPAVKMGLKYMKYSILPRESSLLDRYKEDDPVIRDPNSVGVKGWEFTKKVYLDDQMVRLDLQRFRKVLVDSYKYVSNR